ncbi:MAG: hypothetical protein HY850_01950 [Betaproteobacteria bacterium]|nr:hypothetical protein [Betaproteobacteria bacterium]
MDALLDAMQLQSLKTELEALPPRPHHAGILAVVQKYLPAYRFDYALNRGGWYRLGGVIGPDGARLAQDLEAWAETELLDCAGDMEVLLERHADAGLLATRLSGRGHYFVAAYGAEPSQFLQLEIEEVQEVLDRQLIDPDHAPSDLSELVDPISPLTLPAQPVGAPAYRFRRLTDMQQALARLPAALPGQSSMRRFLEEWVLGSVAKQGHFCDHWIVALREHQDRYRNTVLAATPTSRHARKLKSFPWDIELRGVRLAEQIQAFDRAASHTGAWYSHLVVGALTPRAIAFALGQDIEAGFSYLPDAEAGLLKRWLASPYAV